MRRAHGPRICKIGPDGAVRTVFPRHRVPTITYFPGTNIGALIAKIGNVVFAVGSRYDNPAPADGVIFLAMNESPNNNNQAGSLLAQIIIFDDE